MKRVVKSVPSWVSIITVFLAIGALVLNFVLDISSDPYLPLKIIAAMLVVIAVESFVKQVFCLEGINEKLDNLRPQDSSFVEILKRNECKDLNAVINGAIHELFISGVNLQSLSNKINDLLNASRRGIKIRLLIFNLDNSSLMDAYINMKGDELRGPDKAEIFMKHFRNCKDVEVKIIDSIMPVMFIASDMDKRYGYIKAEHFFNNAAETDLPNIELSPDKDWYNAYYEQIEAIWNKAESYNP